MKHEIFISYSRNDKDVVLPYVKQINEAVGRDCWIDLKGIESGVEFEEIIIKAIDDCQVVLFMLSDNSLRSKWTKREVIYAEDEDKRIVPVLVDGDGLRGWFKFHFGNVDFIDIRSDEQKEKLVENLKTWLGIEEKKTKPKNIGEVKKEPNYKNVKDVGTAQKPEVATTLPPTAKRESDEKEKPNIIKTCVAKVIPETIGDLVYFDTTNPNEEPPITRAQFLRNKILTVIVVLALLALLFFLYQTYDWNGWLCGGIGFMALLYGIGTVVDDYFGGKDYFVGIEGFAIYEFKDERDNIVKIEELKYDDFDFILHEETDTYKDYEYANTSYKFSMIKNTNEIKEEKYCIEGVYIRNSRDVVYDFAKRVEEYYTNVHFKSVLNQFFKQGVIDFQYMSDYISFSISLFINGDIRLGKRLIKQNDIISLFCKEGKLVVIYKDNDKKEKRHELELGCIGNRLMLLDLLRRTQEKMEIKS